MDKKQGKFTNLKGQINKAIYNYDEQLLRHENKETFDNFIKQNIFDNGYTSLIGGIFLTGFLLYIGASESVVSYVSIISTLCGIFVIFFVNWLQKFTNLKKVVLTFSIITRLLSVLSVFVPLLLPKNLWTPIALGLIFLSFIFKSLNGNIFNVWFMSLIPMNVRGRYYSVRHSLGLVVTMIMPIIAGFFLDIMKKNNLEYLSFIIIFVTAGISGLLEILILRKSKGIITELPKNKMNLLDVFKIPIQNKEFLNHVFRTGLFYLFFYMSATFHNIYLLNYLNLSYTYINIINVISPAIQILFFLKVWGVVSDAISSGFVFLISICIFVLDCFIWTNINSKTVYFLYPLLQIVAAFEWSAFNATQFNRRYEFIPDNQRLIYDSFYSFVVGIFLVITPILSRFIRSTATNIEFFKNFEHGEIRIVFFISTISILILSFANIKDSLKNDKETPFKNKENFTYALTIFKRYFKKSWKLTAIVFVILVLFGTLSALI